MAKAYYLEGYFYYLKGESDKAIKKAKESFSLVSQLNDSKLEGESLQLLIGTYFTVNKYTEAEKFALLLAEKSRNNKETAYFEIIADVFLGLINDELNYYNLSILYYQKADSINNALQPENFQNYKGAIYGNTFIVFLKLKDYEKAEKYLNKAKKLHTDKNSEQYNIVKQNYGYLEVERENYQVALDILIKTKQYFKTKNELYHQGESSFLLGRAYFGLADYTLAKNNFNESLEIFQTIGDSLSIGLSHKYLGDTYLNNPTNFQNAKTNLTKALYIFNNLDSYDNQINALQSLSKLMQLKNNYKEAFKYQKRKDSINNVFQKLIRQRNIYEIETQFQTKQKEKEIVILKTQGELLEQQKKSQLYLLLTGVFVLLVSGVFMFFQYKSKIKTNKNLRELDEVKSNFFTNISHEFRTPLTLIKGPINLQLKKKELQPGDRENFEMINRNTDRLLYLVDQILNISKIESGNLSLNISKNYLLPFVGTLIDGFSFLAKEKNVTITNISSDTNIETWFDISFVENIVLNLMSNALKYTPKDGFILTHSLIKNNQLYFEIKNTGVPLSKEELDSIFNRFYQTNTNNRGIGLGLALVKELVQAHKGTMTISNEKDKWTVFKVRFPINKEAYILNEINSNSDTNTVISKINPPTENDFIHLDDDDLIYEETNPTLLIVDDNTDILQFVSSLFTNSFTILTAKDGEEGELKAFKYIPDLIISDVMMPIKDGFELCNSLKTDQRTSHIPIILLTAKAGDENEFVGIENGADDYITKPFNDELLKLKVKKLLETRKKLQEHFSQELILIPKNIEINTTEETFLRNIQSILNNNLIEPDFSIEKFSKAVGLSRMQLHRKLKALTGYSASEFIRTQRLKLAAQLLIQSNINISQVGYSVGFNDHAYFSKCFKKEFNCSPTEYAKKHK